VGSVKWALHADFGNAIRISVGDVVGRCLMHDEMRSKFDSERLEGNSSTVHVVKLD